MNIQGKQDLQSIKGAYMNARRQGDRAQMSKLKAQAMDILSKKEQEVIATSVDGDPLLLTDQARHWMKGGSRP